MSGQNVPAVHSVHFYDEHSALIERLRGVVASGLQIGNSVLIVATKAHREELVRQLETLGVDVRSHARAGCFAMFDAKETLNTFMVDGMPDKKRFLDSVGNLLKEAKKSARSKDQGLTVFGEMVAVLWEQGNKAGALQLEALWNDVMNERVFHLHCAYPRWNFTNDGDQTGMAEICHAHSHVLVQ